MNILLVDDEPRVLAGLERVLCTDAPAEWQVFTATSGAGALDVMAHDPIDVVVSDMRMPGMDGAELLSQVHARWPGAARLILSGHADQRASVRVAGVAHQFLDKPCDSKRLLATLGRIAAARALIGVDTLPLLGRIGGLPSAPTIYWELSRLLDDDTAGPDRVVAVVRRDPALVAMLLKLVNTSFFGRGTTTTDVGSAVRRLGLLIVRAVALEAVSGPGDASSLERGRSHGLTIAQVAEVVAPASGREDAFVTGMLHDLGERVMAAAAAETRERIDAFMAAGNSRHVAERAVLGVSHAEMGGYLLTLWGFSPVVSQAVAHHHRTWSDGEAPSTVVAAVQVAEALSDRREPDLTALRALGHEAPPAAWTQRIAALGLP